MAPESIAPIVFEVTAACGHLVSGQTYPSYLAEKQRRAQRMACEECRVYPIVVRFKVGSWGGRR